LYKITVQIISFAVLMSAGCASGTAQDSAVGHYLGGRFAVSILDIDVAADAYAEAQAAWPQSAQILHNAFFFKLVSGDVEGAMAYAEALAALPTPPGDGLAELALAARAIKQEQYALAGEHLAGGVMARYLRSVTRIVRAWALSASDGVDSALMTLNESPEDEFKGFFALHEALLDEKAGRFDLARRAYQAALMSGGSGVARSAYGAFLERQGDVDAAREYYELLAGEPGFSRQIARDGSARLEAGRPSRAFQDIAPSKGAAIAFYELGAAILDQAIGRREAAFEAGVDLGEANYNLPLAYIQIALYLDPAFDAALSLKGALYNLYGEHEGAIAALARITPDSPQFAQSCIEQSAALNALGRAEKAVDILKAAIRQQPTSLELRLSLANLFIARGQHEDAAAALDALIALLPPEPEEDAWRFYVVRASALLALNAWPRAEADLRRAVEIAPEEPNALNYLGYSWAERGENLEQAFMLIEKAVSLEPRSGAIIDSLGWAHYQLNRFDEAVGHLERAAALEPGDPTITDHLGDVYWRLGRTLEARYQWQRVLELEAPEDLRARIAEKLDQGLPDTDE
jgi:tetratricopeptide (TPR) repeat protein